MAYWQGILVTVGIIGLVVLVAFLLRNRFNDQPQWREDMDLRADEFVNRSGGGGL